MTETKDSNKQNVKSKKVIEDTQAKGAEAEEERLTSNVEPRTSNLAKAGKRSAKVVKEAEEKEAKEAKKAVKADAPVKKAPQKPPRTRLERAGKKYREAAKKIDKDKTYTLAEAVALASQTSPAKFDATVELHINLNADPKQAEQNVRGSVVLPAGSGKSLRIAVLAEGDEADKAKKAGADLVGKDDILARLEKEQLDFDILITNPQHMALLGKYAKFLGPRGLMPNPKSGTVTNDVAKAITEAKAGRVEYRMDGAGIIHLSVGKVSFGADKLLQNAEAAMASIKTARPPAIKGQYIKSAYISTTMGPAVAVDL